MSTPQRTALWQRLAGDTEFVRFLQEERDVTYKALLTSKDELTGRLQGRASFIEEMVRHINTARGS